MAPPKTGAFRGRIAAERNFCKHSFVAIKGFYDAEIEDFSFRRGEYLVLAPSTPAIIKKLDDIYQQNDLRVQETKVKS